MHCTAPAGARAFKEKAARTKAPKPHVALPGSCTSAWGVRSTPTATTTTPACKCPLFIYLYPFVIFVLFSCTRSKTAHRAPRDIVFTHIGVFQAWRVLHVNRNHNRASVRTPIILLVVSVRYVRFYSVVSVQKQPTARAFLCSHILVLSWHRGMCSASTARNRMRRQVCGHAKDRSFIHHRRASIHQPTYRPSRKPQGVRACKGTAAAAGTCARGVCIGEHARAEPCACMSVCMCRRACKRRARPPFINQPISRLESIHASANLSTTAPR